MCRLADEAAPHFLHLLATEVSNYNPSIDQPSPTLGRYCFLAHTSESYRGQHIEAISIRYRIRGNLYLSSLLQFFTRMRQKTMHTPERGFGNISMGIWGFQSLPLLGNMRYEIKKLY